MEEVDKEISEMKLSLNARARIVAESYLTAVSRLVLMSLLQLDVGQNPDNLDDGRSQCSPLGIWHQRSQA